MCLGYSTQKHEHIYTYKNTHTHTCKHTLTGTQIHTVAHSSPQIRKHILKIKATLNFYTTNQREDLQWQSMPVLYDIGYESFHLIYICLLI